MNLLWPDLVRALKGHSRIIVVGGPHSGKTQLASELWSENGTPARHTDDLISVLPWSALSEEVSKWFDEPRYGCIEGVATARALRKWLARVPDQSPGTVVRLSNAFAPLTDGQRRMAKGVDTVWAEIEPELQRRGVTIL